MDGMTLPEGARRGPNCGVTAVAIAAGVSFDRAHAVLRPLAQVAMPYMKRWHGKTNHDMRMAALTTLGVKYEQVPVAAPWVTLTDFARAFAKSGCRYMVRIRGHVQMVKDGFVIDQSGSGPVESSPHRRARVTAITLIH